MKAIDEVVLCIKSLREAMEHAQIANAAWHEHTGCSYNVIVEYQHRLADLPSRVEQYAATRLISWIAQERFPGLPVMPEKWAREALDAGIPLGEITAWFADQVAPDAKKKIWANALHQARTMLYRVGDWSENRREAKISHSRLSLQLCFWRQKYGGTWRNQFYDSYVRGALRGLETVIRRANASDDCPRERLLDALTYQDTPGKAATSWVLTPYVRTFKNGRFDIWLRDEVLAQKVKAILEDTNNEEQL